MIFPNSTKISVQIYQVQERFFLSLFVFDAWIGIVPDTHLLILHHELSQVIFILSRAFYLREF